MKTRATLLQAGMSKIFPTQLLDLVGGVGGSTILVKYIIALCDGPLQPQEDLVPEELVVDGIIACFFKQWNITA